MVIDQCIECFWGRHVDDPGTIDLEIEDEGVADPDGVWYREDPAADDGRKAVRGDERPANYPGMDGMLDDKFKLKVIASIRADQSRRQETLAGFAADAVAGWLSLPGRVDTATASKWSGDGARDRVDAGTVPQTALDPDTPGAGAFDQATALGEKQAALFEERKVQAKGVTDPRAEAFKQQAKQVFAQLACGGAAMPAAHPKDALEERLLCVPSKDGLRDRVRTAVRRYRSGASILPHSAVFPAHAPEQEVFSVMHELAHAPGKWTNHEQFAVIALGTPVLAALYAKSLESNSDAGLPARYGWFDFAANAAQSSMMDEAIAANWRAGDDPKSPWHHCPSGSDFDWTTFLRDPSPENLRVAWGFLSRPMRMSVFGAGGTGKTLCGATILRVGFSFFLGPEFNQQLLAPTNRAATLLPGGANTIHSFTNSMGGWGGGGCGVVVVTK